MRPGRLWPDVCRVDPVLVARLPGRHGSATGGEIDVFYGDIELRGAS
jgi:hypothetical protein